MYRVNYDRMLVLEREGSALMDETTGGNSICQTYYLVHRSVETFLFENTVDEKIINFLLDLNVIYEDTETQENSFVKPFSFTDNG